MAVLPVYFFPGPESGQKRERIESLRQELAKQDGEDPEIHRFYPYDTESSDIADLLKNGSLFSARRLVIVADAHALKAADIKIFKEYIKTPSRDAVLIFTTDEGPGARGYPRSLADALPKKATQVFWEMFERDKRSWVMRFFREKGLRAENNAVSLLLDMTEGTSDALKEACARLAFSVPQDREITEKDVDSALEHSREESAYSLFDRFCRRDAEGVLDAYRKIIHTEKGTMVLTMLADPLIGLRDFSELTSRGLSADQAVKEAKIRGGKRALRACSEGARNFTLTELDTIVRQLADLEAWLRTAPAEIRHTKTEIWFCSVLRKNSVSAHRY